MTEEKRIEGMVTPGKGKAHAFLQINWVKERFLEKSGFIPFPGTLNLKVRQEDFDYLRKLAFSLGERLIPSPKEELCEARLLPVKVGGVTSALVFPMVDDYYSDVLELVAPVKLRQHLKLSDNDRLQFFVILPQKLPFPQGIIFDLDGTLIDSVDHYYEIFCEGCCEAGLPTPQRDKVLDYMGRGFGYWEIWEELLPEGNSQMKKEELRKNFAFTLRDIWRRGYDQKINFFSGVADVLSRLQESRVTMGVVTSSSYSNKMNIFKANGINPDRYFRSMITREDTTKHKPDPEPLLLCLERLQVTAKECLYVGDSPCDIIAGKKAGLSTVGVLTGAGTCSSLSRAGADHILSHIDELIGMFDSEREIR
ncbi:MAG TPA: HAD-IA family hydrolase [Firmicutes bacterium]|jgi:HAD superfamily hydrolase (TIGR01549 family)|nr:HAD-IA family hydrolase [Bacillota bacterium]